MDKRDNALDGIRGIAILAVIIHHITLEFRSFELSVPWIHSLRSIADYGWLGVDLFFVLSGYLITGILLHTRHSPNYYSAFYLRRAVRIFPLFYAVLIPLFVLVFTLTWLGYRFDYFQLSTLTVSSALTYTLNFVMALVKSSPKVPNVILHLWSLCVEEQFYAIWPAIIRSISMPLLSALLVCLFILSLACRLYFQSLNMGPAVTVFTFSRLDGLACGAALAMLIRTPAGADALARLWRPLLCLGTCGFLATLALNSAHFTPRTYGRSFAILAFAAILASIVLPSASLLRSTFERPVFCFFGKYSYGLYVLHPFAIFLIAHRMPRYYLPPSVEVFTFSLQIFALSIAAAWFSWRFVETPFLNLKKRKAFQYIT